MPSKSRAFAEAILETSRKQMGQAIQWSNFDSSASLENAVDELTRMRQDENPRGWTLWQSPFDRCEVSLKPGYEPDLPD